MQAAKLLVRRHPTVSNKWRALKEAVFSGRNKLISQEEVLVEGRSFGIVEDECIRMLHYYTLIGEIIYFNRLNLIAIDVEWLLTISWQLCTLAVENDGSVTLSDIVRITGKVKEEEQLKLMNALSDCGLVAWLNSNNYTFVSQLQIGQPPKSRWPTLPNRNEKQITYKIRCELFTMNTFNDILEEISSRRCSLVKSIDPLFLHTTVVFEVSSTQTSCHYHSMENSGLSLSNQQERSINIHKLHIFMDHRNTCFLVTARGHQPCCMIIFALDIVRSALKKSCTEALFSEHLLCPKCELSGLVTEMASANLNDCVCPRGHIVSDSDIQLGYSGDLDQVRDQDAINNLESFDCPSKCVVLKLSEDRVALHFLCESPASEHFIECNGMPLMGNAERQRALKDQEQQLRYEQNRQRQREKDRQIAKGITVVGSLAFSLLGVAVPSGTVHSVGTIGKGLTDAAGKVVSSAGNVVALPIRNSNSIPKHPVGQEIDALLCFPNILINASGPLRNELRKCIKDAESDGSFLGLYPLFIKGKCFWLCKDCYRKLSPVDTFNF